jgi:hypothetical protein
MSKLVFSIGDKLIKFTIDDFEDNLDIDRLLKIDYGNLVAELVTSPVILNKVGILAAEMSNELRLSKMNFKIREAKIQKQVRENLIEEGKKATVAEVEDGLITNKVYQKYQKEYYEVEKQKDYIDSIYNAIKDKSNKLDKLSLTLRVGDINEELIQKQLNNVYYKIKDND